jgi:hypothetical protein
MRDFCGGKKMENGAVNYDGVNPGGMALSFTSC